MIETNGMTFLTDRKEIAKAINIDRIPVITIDIGKHMDGFENCYEGSRIRIDGAYKGRYSDMLVRCTARMYGDEHGNDCHSTPQFYKRIVLQPSVVAIADSFGLTDVDEMVKWNNTPIVKAGDKVVVYFRDREAGSLRLMRIGERLDPHCMVVTTLTDGWEE